MKTILLLTMFTFISCTKSFDSKQFFNVQDYDVANNKLVTECQSPEQISKILNLNPRLKGKVDESTIDQKFIESTKVCVLNDVTVREWCEGLSDKNEVVSYWTTQLNKHGTVNCKNISK